MKRTIRAVLVVVVAMLLGSAVSAQRAAARQGGQAASSIRIGVGAGLLLPIGDYKTADKLGWLGGADVTYWLTGGMFGIRAEGSYSQTSEASGVTPHKTKIFGGMADVVWAPGTSADQIRPYLLAGLGFYNVKIDITGFGSGSETKVGFGGGAGAAFKVGTGGTRVFVEGKFVSVSTDVTKTNFIPIRAGVRFATK